MHVAGGSFGPDQYPHAILAIFLASAIAASTESVVRRLWNNAKDGLCLCDIAAVRRQSGITAVRALKCIVEFLHDGLAIRAVDDADAGERPVPPSKPRLRPCQRAARCSGPAVVSTEAPMRLKL